MSGSLSLQGIRAVLLDIEGTTTPVDFVYQVLFPYARTNMKAFLEEHPAAASAELELLRTEYEQDRARGLEPPPWEPVGPVSYAHWLMDRDRKSTGLKSLQGKIWEQGYRSGELRGEVYPDVPVAFERWRKQGMRISIYSSGSVLAQKLLFAHSTAGDLTRFLDAHFDTTTGPKRETGSYLKIAAALSLAPSTIVFFSDVPAELDAALEAGMKTSLCWRAATDPPNDINHPVVGTLIEAEN
jgi:enolase-phosphatase E1